MAVKNLPRLLANAMERQQMPTFLPGSNASCSLYLATRAGSGNSAADAATLARAKRATDATPQSSAAAATVTAATDDAIRQLDIRTSRRPTVTAQVG